MFNMVRISLVVPLLAFAIGIHASQANSTKVVARGGYQFVGVEGDAAGSISGEIFTNPKKKTDLMIVLKDVGGITFERQNEAIIFLKSVTKHSLRNNVLIIAGKGTFQGEEREIELTLIDSGKVKEPDQFRVRVWNNRRVELDHSAKLDSTAITISRDEK